MSPAARDAREDLMDHEYDGIRMNDHPPPKWWSWLFIATIAFSALYWVYYHLGVGPTIQQEYDTVGTIARERQLGSLGILTPTDETMLRLLSDEPDTIASMRGMFQDKCAQCHGPGGGGNVFGPNLTDEAYKNITRPSDIISVITDGVPGKAMAGWGRRLREPQIILLATYVASLRGTRVAGGKAGEGDTIPPWSSFGTPPDVSAETEPRSESDG